MAEALKTKDIVEWTTKLTAKKAKITQRASKRGSIRGKAFTALSRAEKDELLFLLAQQAGLLDDNGKVS